MYAAPVTPNNEYQPGDTIECFADAFPEPTYEWHNTRTGERYGKTSTVQTSWLGFEQVLRCIASNIINGLPFIQEMAIIVNVPVPTTTPEPTSPTTTTTPPPVSYCNDISGRWMSTGPSHAVMCLEVDKSSGMVQGVLRNDTDVFWLDIVGTTDLPLHDHLTFSAIWPLNRAVSSFIGECSRCDGREVLLVNAISRSKGGPPCGTPGQIQYTVQYQFERHAIPTCPPISFPT